MEVFPCASPASHALRNGKGKVHEFTRIHRRTHLVADQRALPRIGNAVLVAKCADHPHIHRAASRIGDCAEFSAVDCGAAIIKHVLQIRLQPIGTGVLPPMQLFTAPVAQPFDRAGQIGHQAVPCHLQSRRPPADVARIFGKGSGEPAPVAFGNMLGVIKRCPCHPVITALAIEHHPASVSDDGLANVYGHCRIGIGRNGAVRRHALGKP